MKTNENYLNRGDYCCICEKEMTNRRAEVCKKQFRKMINGGIWCVYVVSMKRLSHENKQKHQKIIYKQQNKKKNATKMNRKQKTNKTKKQEKRDR